jgi:hypothetical protein
MTIMIVSFTPKEILFASDTFRYFLKEDTTERVLNHTLEITHDNLKEHIESYETNAPKIHKLGKSTGLIAGGDGRFQSVIENLNPRRSIKKQILERLEQKGKLDAFWSCHIGRVREGKVELTSIVYESGKITTNEHNKEDITFDSFAPEMKKRFPFMVFYLANTQEKITVINEFFKETTARYGGLAGGTPQIATLNENGFQWIHPHNFTGYSLNWMPEKIETMASSELAWSSQDWTDILELGFECESTMLCIILIDARGSIKKDAGTAEANAEYRLLLDGNYISGTFGWIGKVEFTVNEALHGHYSMHTVAVVPKGSHTLTMQMIANIGGSTARAYDRRLTIIKGFYQGGTT